MSDPASDDTPRETDADPPRPVAPGLLLAVAGVMTALVAGLVWSTGRGLRWW